MSLLAQIRMFGLCVLVSIGAARSLLAQDDALAGVKEALTDELYSLAEKQLREHLAASQSPRSDHEARALLAEALYGQKAYTGILDFLESSDPKVKVTPAPDGSSVYWRAMARFGLQQFDAVGDYLSDFETRHPGSSYRRDMLRLRGLSLHKAGKTDDAVKAFSAFDLADVTGVEASANLVNWGLALIAIDRPKEAEAVLTRLRKEFPGSPDAQRGTYWLGESMVHQQRWDEAEALLLGLGKQADARKDLRTSAWYALADVYQSRKKVDAAVHALSQGISIASDPKTEREGRLVLGQLLVRQGRLKEGIPLLKAFIGASPGDPNAGPLQLFLADQLLKAGEAERAVTEYQHYLESFKDPAGIADASYGKAWGLYRLDRYAEAATAFNKAFGLYDAGERKEESLLKTGDSYFKNKQYELAMKTYGTLSQSFTNSSLRVQAMYQVGECHVERKAFGDAQKQFELISQKFPKDRFAEKSLLRIAVMYKDQRDYKSALKGFDHALQRFPKGVYTAEVLLQRGELLWQKIDFKGALADFTKVVTTYPKTEQAQKAYYWQGVCAYYSGDEAGAVKIWESYINTYASSPDVPDVLYWIGQHEYNQGKHADAETRLLGLETNYPEHSRADDALYLAGRAASEQKEFRRANEHFTGLVKKYPKSNKLVETRFFQAENFCELIKYSEAIVLYDTIIRNHPESFLIERAWLRKGYCHYMAGVQDSQELEPAIAAYKQVLASKTASLGMKYQAEHGIGLCFTKMGRDADAFEQYYKVITEFQKARRSGVRQSEVAELWFTRAAYAAAEFQEKQSNWREAVNIYQHLVDADVPAAKEAQERMDSIRAEHWLLF